MIKSFEPGSLVYLWLYYMKDYVPISGLTDLTIQIRDTDNNILLNSETLDEEVGFPAKYSYEWDTSSIQNRDRLLVYYRKGSEIIAIEEYTAHPTRSTIYEDIQDMAQDLLFVKGIEGGGWKIDKANNQMIFYDSDNTTEIMRVNLFNDAGNPDSDNVFERRRI